MTDVLAAIDPTHIDVGSFLAKARSRPRAWAIAATVPSGFLPHDPSRPRFFFAGYEIDVRRVSGSPLRLASLGWALSLLIAYTVGGILAAAGIVLSLLYTGSALATTAIGTLIPILSDSGELETRFGTYLLAAGAVGEFGPILLLTLILTTADALRSAVILVAFIALAVAVAILAVRSAGRTLPLLERTLDASSQLAVRWIVVLVFALALLASNLGLDLLLGGFAAGLITRDSRWSSQSPPSPSPTVICGPRPPPRSSARRSSRP